jgi:hypothetical protein
MEGTFNQSILGPFQYTSGSVYVNGTLSNVGQTLALSSSTGSWILSGCTLEGGTVSSSHGAGLSVDTENGGGTMTNGVVLDAPVSLPAGSTLTVMNGLTDNNVISMVGTRASNLNFSGTQTLAGSGQVELNSGNASLIDSTSGTLTIGPNLTIATIGGGGTIGSTTSGTAIINMGTISAQTAATINIAGTFTNAGTISASNSGNVSINPSGLTNLTSGVLNAGIWQVFSGSSLSLGTSTITTNNASILLSGSGSNFSSPEFSYRQ